MLLFCDRRELTERNVVFKQIERRSEILYSVENNYNSASKLHY